ncbi:KGK domain-containing protein [Myxosarcina sp. GI1]|uniref:KGK domain-containing protein n=1 Tax=Myxosarcina sp. GI1 TaxID=1541065 RepID=UPI000566D157|nr:KGK domain-containing protein [Myxosarcina sp. GI1]
MNNIKQTNTDDDFLYFNEHLNKYDAKDVLSTNNSIITIGEFKKNVTETFRRNGMGSIGQFLSNTCKGLNPSKWLIEGDECEILSANHLGWQKGKIKIKMTLEFIPDKPEENISESPLDSIRQEITE